MPLDNWAEGIVEGMLDKSFLARAMRKSTAKAAVLGMLDAIQNPNAVLAEIVGVESQGAPAAVGDKVIPVAPASAAPPTNPPPPVTLPRPMLLSMPKSEQSDEPDQPGVPPRKVRKQKRQSPANGAVESPPENSGPTPGDPAE